MQRNEDADPWRLQRSWIDEPEAPTGGLRARLSRFRLRWKLPLK